MKTNRILYLLISLLLTCTTLYSQNPEGLLSHKIYAPDKVTQGNRVQVKYVIEATNMSDTKLPEVYGGRMVDADASDEVVDGLYYKRTLSCVFEVYCIGYFEIDPLSITVDGVRVSSERIVIEASPDPDYGQE